MAGYRNLRSDGENDPMNTGLYCIHGLHPAELRLHTRAKHNPRRISQDRFDSIGVGHKQIGGKLRCVDNQDAIAIASKV